jgi:hypothetical protein
VHAYLVRGCRPLAGRAAKNAIVENDQQSYESTKQNILYSHNNNYGGPLLRLQYQRRYAGQ